MVTDEERREVAENLRGMCSRECRYAEQFYELLNETVMREWDFHSFQDVADRLADLIEPEPERTCHMVCDYLTDTVYCDVCGERFDSVAQYMAVVPDAFNYKAEYKDAKFCPNCGAKVVEE